MLTPYYKKPWSHSRSHCQLRYLGLVMSMRNLMKLNINDLNVLSFPCQHFHIPPYSSPVYATQEKSNLSNFAN